jgi:hypothetical protein
MMADSITEARNKNGIKALKEKSANKQYPKQKSAKISTNFNT